MAEIIRMPKMSDTMTEGVIANWLKKVGDNVKSGDILAEVETDKATMELENYTDGVLLHIGIEKGQAVAVDGLIAIIGEKGENIDALLASQKGGTNAAANPQKEVQTAPVAEKAVVAVAVDTSDVKATVVRMPKMSDTMTDGTIAKWLKKVGDKVKTGDILAEVETDKATMELENYEDGFLLYIGVEAGQAVAVDGIIAIIGEKDANYQKLLQADSVPPKQEIKQENAPAVQQHTTTTAVPQGSDSRIKASPLAKSLAKERGFNISNIKGSGENGRIVRRDVENFKPEATPATQTSSPQVATSVGFGQESYTEMVVTQMRKTIAKRLSESLFTAPHFYLTMEIVMDKAMEARASLNEIAPIKISFNDMVIKACAMALRKHPMVNAAWMGDKIRINQHVHIGIAVAVEDGLLVPVVRFADMKTLSQIGAEAKELAGKAKNKKLQPAEWAGNTFTVSNLGMFGIEEFTSIINSPDACLLSVGGIKQTPIVKDGQIVIGNIMKVSLACDHRVVDGATGAAFLQTFKGLIEDPVRMLA